MPRIENRKHSALYLGRRIIGDVWAHPNNVGRRGRAVARSVAWQVRKRVGSHQSTRTVFGTMKIWMNPEFGSTSNIVYFGDHFDTDEMDFLERYLRPGDRFVDVGANVGTYTLLGASLVGPSGRVDAFEPVPQLAEELRRNIALNGIESYVFPHDVAVTDYAGEVRFRADRDVSSRIAIDRDPHNRVTVVRCDRLDDLLPDGEIALMKIDVEGAEAAVLRGFIEHLNAGNPPVIILEVLPSQLERQGSSLREVLDILAAAGYESAAYSAHTGKMTWVNGQPSLGNVLAVLRQRSTEVFRRLATSEQSD